MNRTHATAPASLSRIYYVHPLMLKGGEAWSEIFAHARELGFDTVMTGPIFKRLASIFVSQDFDRTDPQLGLAEIAVEALADLVDRAAEHELKLICDIVIDQVPLDREHPDKNALDPRRPPQDTGRQRDPGSLLENLGEWQARLKLYAETGVSGFRCMGIDRVDSNIWKQIIDEVHRQKPDTRFLAWTPGVAMEKRFALKGSGFSGTFSSMAWWDMEQHWLLEENDAQRSLGCQIAFPEPPFAKRIAHGMDSVQILQRRAARALHLAASLCGGILVPMGFEYGIGAALDPTYGDGAGLAGLKAQHQFDLCAEIQSINEKIRTTEARFDRRSLRLMTSGRTPAMALVQSDHEDIRSAAHVRVTLVNRDIRRTATAPFHMIETVISGFLPLVASNDVQQSLNETTLLQPGETLVFEGISSVPILLQDRNEPVLDATASSRLAIEKITPSVDGGRFPAKRVMGEVVHVEADIFADGHDPLAACLLWRAADEKDWHEERMNLVVNDRWQAFFPLKRLGRHEFAVEAWRNPFAIFRYELVKKHEARLDLRLENQEGMILIRSAADHASDEIKAELENLHYVLSRAADPEQTRLLLESETTELMTKADRRPFRVRSEIIPLDAERTGAGFASWYQIFPRSQSGDPNRHGTFDDVIGRLPTIRAMGFDVLYFPPIHPIGKTNKKGKNNSLQAGPDDPGSPYAIGSEHGGHDAIHPQLGTFGDFRRLIDAAHSNGLEIALDLAIQASPDHPWLKDHSGWFDWRPDGTIRYAENPPKKYEDIVNVDFYAKDAVPSLWETLRDVVQVWVDQGVKLFRVDNPHTKPFPFWEWLIGDIRARHPDVVFLSEAFTKPKVMYRLAKIGFSQSYTYFTWRNAKWELEQYMREITTEEPKEFFRPHFFVNTHDINPDFLQNAPRSAYLIRAALAATLSGLWGVYNGFELCEGRPDAKRKEYADSEKYEIRAWDWDRPGNIISEITMLNRIRSDNASLHSHLGLTLLTAWNDNIMFFEKASTARENVLLMAISLDPHAVQEADIEIPLWSWNLPDHGALVLEDLIGGDTFTLTGKRQRVRLEPNMPFAIWRVK